MRTSARCVAAVSAFSAVSAVSAVSVVAVVAVAVAAVATVFKSLFYFICVIVCNPRRLGQLMLANASFCQFKSS